MSIILKRSPTGIQSTFLHIPKTGGMFVRKTLADNGLVDTEILRSPSLYATSEYTLKTQHNIPFNYPKFMDSDIVFAFVRNPIIWYQSYWAFKVSINRWYINKPIDRICGDRVFSKFIDKILYTFRDGYLSTMYSMYTQLCTHVGRQEDMLNDLGNILDNVGFNEFKIDNELRVNDGPEEYKKLARYRQDQIPMLLSVESGIMRKYRYEIDQDFYQNHKFIK